MDYELTRDIYGRPQARLSMGHEALGLWLSEEVGVDQPLILGLMEKVTQLQHHRCVEHKHSGHEFVLTMNQDGIEVRAALLDDSADEASDGLSHYDQESESHCGLDDFRQLLEAWQEFTAGGYRR
jgi:uncharacterized protein YacL (UPF0231 family)